MKYSTSVSQSRSNQLRLSLLACQPLLLLLHKNLNRKSSSLLYLSHQVYLHHSNHHKNNNSNNRLLYLFHQTWLLLSLQNSSKNSLLCLRFIARLH